MRQNQSDAMSRRALGWTIMAVGVVAAAGLGLGGCEMDSFMDPSVVGRWEPTPVQLPILESLDVIEKEDTLGLKATPVRPADLIPDVREYIIGPSDLLVVNVFELLFPGQDSVFQRRVDETGVIRLPVIGSVRAQGMSPSELEAHIASILEQKGVLRDPTVSVILAEARGNTFSIIGAPSEGNTAYGTYQIPKPDFRLLDAIALARGVSERVKTLTIFRQAPLTPAVAGEAPQTTAPQEDQPQAAPPAPTDPSELIEELMQGVEQPGAGTAAPGAPEGPGDSQAPAAPAGMEAGIEPDTGAQWVNAGGKWVRVDDADTRAPNMAVSQEEYEQIQEEFSGMIAQRLIEVPYNRLMAGDMRYNIVIRPGDVIRVPETNAGFVYVMGAINRPGAYSVPGFNELTIKQIIAAAGGLSQLAMPQKVDLIRRIGPSQEATVRLDVKAIFDGTAPDIFLKPNDQLNFGTSFWATPLAIFRNGLRVSYGFGFVLDRNFANDVFGRQ